MREELQKIALSPEFRKDLLKVRALSTKAIDADSYCAFVVFFDEFVNHRARPFRPIQDRDMRL
ncbi:MAG: hypothetical protein ACUVTO_09450 [Candidatus Caldatribacteriaceae bacterium]